MRTKTIYSIVITNVILLFLIGCGKEESHPNEQPNKPSQEEPKPEITTRYSFISQPTQTTYFLNDPFNKEGIQITEKQGEKTVNIPLSDITVSNFDSKKSGEQLIKLSVGDTIFDFTVTVYPFIVDANKQITSYPEDLEIVVIPEGIKSIGEKVFSCKKMKSITFPSTLETIKKQAFIQAENLQEITFPASLTTIESAAFIYCAGLKKVDLSQTKLTTLTGELFASCKSLTEVILSNTIQYIDYQAFYRTNSLQKIVLSDQLLSIANNAFRFSGIAEIELPNSIQNIGQNAFQSCQQLKRVTTKGNSSTTTKLNDIADPMINYCAFDNVPLLEELQLPYSITKLGQNCIAKAPLLKQLTIPASVTKINYFALSNSNLTTIILAGKTPPTTIEVPETNVWDAFPTNISIQVPKGSEEQYKRAQGWKTYNNKITTQQN